MKKELRNTGFSTRAIHSGYDPAENQMALIAPPYVTSTFVFDTSEQGSRIFAGEEDGYFYTRISHPGQELLANRLADLEGAPAGAVMSTGMGAITTTMWTLLKPGDEIIVDKTLYGCTFAFITKGLDKFGIKHTHVDLSDIEAYKAAITPNTKLVYFESPANPNMHLVDIQAVSDIAHDNDMLVLVDNTYSTAYLQRPMDMGADYVLYSATKFINGHGDVVAGAVMGPKESIEEIRFLGIKDFTGASLSPQDANLVVRGLKTLELRMERHCDSAEKVAKFLEEHDAVDRVYYPGLKSFEQYDLACKQMKRFGGMIAFEMKGGIEAGRKLMNSLNLVTRAVSLGTCESLIQHPASMTHSAYPPEEREKYGITEGLVRMSVGLEQCDDILADLDQGLSKTSTKSNMVAA